MKSERTSESKILCSTKSKTSPTRGQLNKISLVKGFNDYIGEEAKKRAEIRKVLIENFEKYGFEPAETPVLEYEEFVKGDNPKDEAVSDIFKLEDKGKRKLALRYEFTFQLKRIMQNQKLPFKRYQIGPVFRDEPVSGNRVRQITQADADIIGADIKDEAEILALGQRVLKDLGTDFVIYFNNRKLLNEILDKEGIKKKEEVIRELDKLDKLPEKEVAKNLKKYKADKVLKILKKSEKEFSKYDAYSEIKELKKYLKIYGVKGKFSPFLARGLSYYNRTVFEIKTSKMKETITGGGSFMFNGVQSTGISFGIDRLASLAEIKDEEESYLVLGIGKDKEAIEVAEKLRGEGKSVIVLFDKVSKALEYANSKEIDKVVFVGEKEVKAGKLKVKDMKSGKEIFLKF